MKKIKYIIILITGFSIAACSDFLDTSTPSKLVGPTVYTSVFYTQNEVMGIYSLVANDNLYAKSVSLLWSTNTDIEFAGADTTTITQNTNRGSSNYYGTSANPVLPWTNIYKMIERANLCVEGINNSPLLFQKDSTTMKILRGEALTMRAMGYYELVKHWGDIPFKEDPTLPNLSNVYLGKTNRDTIYNHMIKDLLVAEKSVPWVGQLSYTSEKITKGFIKGLIARICLSAGGYSLRDKPGYPMERVAKWKDYYVLANQKCKEIIDNGTHKLNPSYLSVWKNINALTLDQTYNENMFEVALGLGQNGEMGYTTGVRFYKNTKYGLGNNANTVNTSAYYFYSFDRNDLRRDVTVAKETYGKTGLPKEDFTANPISYNIGKWDQRWMSSSWLAINMAAAGKFGYGINWVVMRYSDVLLMYAETENELNNGPTDAAKNAIKQVRRRAFAATDYSVKVDNYVNTLGDHDSFFDAITNERAWEFGGEAIRKWDLVRWNKLETKIEEQRQKFQAMLNGEAVTIFGNSYSSLPANIYWKYAADNENIDWANVNYYEQKSDLDLLSTTQLKALGYTKVAWLAGVSVTTKNIYNGTLRLFSSGLQMRYNGVCDNRYLFPIYSTAISDSNGALKNSYGF